jgi:hypothetical protein
MVVIKEKEVKEAIQIAAWSLLATRPNTDVVAPAVPARARVLGAERGTNVAEPWI